VNKSDADTTKGEQFNKNDYLLSEYFSEMFVQESTPSEIVTDAPQQKDISYQTEGGVAEALQSNDDEDASISTMPGGSGVKPAMSEPAKVTATVSSSVKPKLRRAQLPADEPIPPSSPVLTGSLPKLKPALPKTRVSEETTQVADELTIGKPSTVTTAAEATPKQALESENTLEALIDAKAEVQVETGVTTATATTTTTTAQDSEFKANDVTPTPTRTPDVDTQTLSGLTRESTTNSDGEDASAVIPDALNYRQLQEFEILLFDVKGLQLAVPLVSLGSIHRLDSELTPIVGRADWFLGMLALKDTNLQVVDTARWVMPSRMPKISDVPYEFVIRLADTNWSLACTDVHQSITVKQSDIKWRTSQSKRPWLAGTLIDKMCALLDVDSMTVLLDDNNLHV